MTNSFSRRFFAVAFAILAGCAFVFAQDARPVPRQESLLNGLRVLVFRDTAAPKVTLRVRIHAGSAFDPQGKEGAMRLLADSIFPNETPRNFFREELGGDLSVTTDLDRIQIDASATPDNYLNLIETVAQALANISLTKESVAAVKAPLLRSVRDAAADPGYVADAAAAKRLFGTFPYGRPVVGTEASLEKIDFADLIFLRDRLLSADNATLAVRGNVDPALVARSARRYFGAWLRSDKKIPSTFRQPDAPTAELQTIEAGPAGTAEFRMAARGLSRDNPNFYASRLLRTILEARLKKKEGEAAFVRNDPHVLAGSYVFGVPKWSTDGALRDGTGVTPEMLSELRGSLFKEPVSPAEFDGAKKFWLNARSLENVDELWLDADTYKITVPKSDQDLSKGVTLAAVQAELDRLKKEPFAAVLVFSKAAPPVKN